MAYFYYPLSSKDFTFENIFSSESISPPFFYERRGFGIGYFNVIADINADNAIILYSNPPKFEVENGIKFIIQIDESSLDVDDLIVIKEGIFAYQKTIYLKKNNFYINFFSEKERKITLLRSETSLPTKSIEKYTQNLKIISESACTQYEFGGGQVVANDYNSNSLILEDKKFNKFKGFIYGVVCGLYDKKSSEEVLIRRLIKEITNSFGVIKSRVSESKRPYDYGSYSKKGNSETDIYINHLLNVIKHAEQVYSELSFDKYFNEDHLSSLILKESKHLSSLQEVSMFIRHIKAEDEFFGSKKFEELLKNVSQKNTLPNKNVHFEVLKKQMEVFVEDTVNSNKKGSKINLGKLNDDIKMTIFEIEKSISNTSKDKKLEEDVSLEAIQYDFVNNELTINNSFLNLDSRELQEMGLIVNAILKFSDVDNKLYQKDSILQIVKYVGNIFSKDGKETLLYQYLNNEVDKYEFEKISNSVMKNFVAFVFNTESIEKLERFIDIKNIEKEWMAYSFWGLFNGFANLSGNFTKSIFSKTGESMQNYIDQYLAEYIEILKNLNYKENASDDKTSQSSPVEIFYKKFVDGKYRISEQEFAEIMSIKNKKEFNKELKLRFGILKKESDQLFDSIKRDFDSPLLFN